MRSMPWMLFAMTFAVVLVGALVLALATNNWWLLPAALVVHFLAFVFVVSVIFKALDQQTKPDPTEEARRDEQGVATERVQQEEQDEEPKPVI